MSKKTNPGLKIICLNRKASFNYFFEDLIEAGIVLKGSEIKSIREGKVNIAAKLSSEFQKACVEDKDKAVELNKILQPLHEAMFIESNPSPVKYAASLLKMCNSSVRLPLVEVENTTKVKISEALKVAKIL